MKLITPNPAFLSSLRNRRPSTSSRPLRRLRTAYVAVLSITILVAVAMGMAKRGFSEPISAITALAVANAFVGGAFATPTLGLKTLELVSFSATAPGAGGAAAAALTGDSLAIKNFDKNAQIVAWWADQQTAGRQQLTFPSGHDTTRGIRLITRASEVFNLLPRGIAIDVQRSEQLSINIVGSATAGDVESGSLLVAYEGLPGITGRGIDWTEFRRRYRKLVSVDFTLAGAAAGYTGSEALNSESDLLLPNQDYAIMGAIASAESCSLAIVGPDTGNLRLGLPCSDAENAHTDDFFLDLARTHDEAFIPVINSGNKANTLVSFVQDENNISPEITLLLGMLADTSGK